MLKKSLSVLLSLLMLFTVISAIPFTAQAAVCPSCGGTRVVAQQMPTTDPVTGSIVFQTVYLPCSTCNGSGVVGESSSGDSGSADSGSTSSKSNSNDAMINTSSQDDTE